MAKSHNKDQAAIEGEVLDILKLESDVKNAEAELMKIPQFAAFVKMQKDLQAKSDLVWEAIKNEMIEQGIKSIKGDWGTVTVAERTSFKVDLNVIDEKFTKKAPDNTKIANHFNLEGEAPAGAEPVKTQYLMKRIK